MTKAIRGRIDDIGYLNHYLKSKENVFHEINNKIIKKKIEIKKQTEEIQTCEKNCFQKFNELFDKSFNNSNALFECENEEIYKNLFQKISRMKENLNSKNIDLNDKESEYFKRETNFNICYENLNPEEKCLYEEYDKDYNLSMQNDFVQNEFFNSDSYLKSMSNSNDNILLNFENMINDLKLSNNYSNRSQSNTESLQTVICLDKKISENRNSLSNSNINQDIMVNLRGKYSLSKKSLNRSKDSKECIEIMENLEQEAYDRMDTLKEKKDRLNLLDRFKKPNDIDNKQDIFSNEKISKRIPNSSLIVDQFSSNFKNFEKIDINDFKNNIPYKQQVRENRKRLAKSSCEESTIEKENPSNIPSSLRISNSSRFLNSGFLLEGVKTNKSFFLIRNKRMEQMLNYSMSQEKIHNNPKNHKVASSSKDKKADKNILKNTQYNNSIHISKDKTAPSLNVNTKKSINASFYANNESLSIVFTEREFTQTPNKTNILPEQLISSSKRYSHIEPRYNKIYENNNKSQTEKKQLKDENIPQKQRFLNSGNPIRKSISPISKKIEFSNMINSNLSSKNLIKKNIDGIDKFSKNTKSTKNIQSSIITTLKSCSENKSYLYTPAKSKK